MSIELGTLTPVDVRSVWKHEAHDFTRWLLRNAARLGDALGMDIELTEAEHKVGGFSLDLIGHEVGTGAVVIVENQLEQTDHGHLGQLLTYAGGTDPTTIVWCAPSFRDEHRAALDWLNLHTTEETRFFGVEISAVQIDNSRPAPLFKVVAKPNDWTKQVQADKSAAVSDRVIAYGEFWTQLLAKVREAHPDWTSASIGQRQNWINLPFGVTGVAYSLVFAQKGLRVEMYIDFGDATVNTRALEAMESERTAIEGAFGARIIFDPLTGKKACRIHYDRPGWPDVLKRDEWPELTAWLLTHFERFRAATQPHKALLQEIR